MKNGTRRITATRTYHQSKVSFNSLQKTYKNRHENRIIVRTPMVQVPHLSEKQQQQERSFVSSVEQWQMQQQHRHPSSSAVSSSRFLTFGVSETASSCSSINGSSSIFSISPSPSAIIISSIFSSSIVLVVSLSLN